LSENIKAIGIVDRFLEHSRFLIFCAGGNDKVYITSADFMPRDLDYRIEVTCPVFDRGIRAVIKNIFEIQWNDNVKARIFDEVQSNTHVINGNKTNQSQVEIYNYLHSKSSNFLP
jgi:polyphosphate kinase